MVAFVGSPKTLRVGSTGRFSHRFVAKPLRGQDQAREHDVGEGGSKTRMLELAEGTATSVLRGKSQDVPAALPSQFPLRAVARVLRFLRSDVDHATEAP